MKQVTEILVAYIAWFYIETIRGGNVHNLSSWKMGTCGAGVTDMHGKIRLLRYLCSRRRRRNELNAVIV